MLLDNLDINDLNLSIIKFIKPFFIYVRIYYMLYKIIINVKQTNFFSSVWAFAMQILITFLII